MRDILGRAASRLLAEPAPRPVRAPRWTGEAGRDLARIADAVFAQVPDVALDRTIRIVGMRSQQGGLWQLGLRRVGSARDAWNITLEDGHLYAPGETGARKALTRIMIAEMRARAIRQAGGDERRPPTWVIAAPAPMADTIARLGIRHSDADSSEIGERMLRALRQLGGGGSFTLQDQRITGDIREAFAPGGDRTTLQILCDDDRGTRVTLVNAPSLPDTAIAQVVGRPLEEVVDVGPLSRGMRITGIEETGLGLRLVLESRLVPLTPMPDGVDRRWIDLVNQYHRQI